MKLYVGFILTNGEIKVRQVNTRNFRNMNIPLHAIGGIVIEPKEMIKAKTFSTSNIDFPAITYFGKRLDSEGNMVRTRAGTLMELPQDALLINI